jgi:hypothetical protein
LKKQGGEGRIREVKKGSEFDQSTLYTSMEIPQWKLFVQLVYKMYLINKYKWQYKQVPSLESNYYHCYIIITMLYYYNMLYYYHC